MFGKLLSIVIKVAELLAADLLNHPAEEDVAVGGDGSKKSRNDQQFPNPLSMLETGRDARADTAKQIDD